MQSINFFFCFALLYFLLIFFSRWFSLFSTEKIGQKIVHLRSQGDEQARQSGWVRNVLDNDQYLVILKKLFESGIWKISD